MTYRSDNGSIGKTIKTVMEKKGVSLYRMAKDLGIAYESLYRSLKEDGNPEWKTIKQILDYLGCEIVLRPKKKKTQEKPSPSKSRRRKGE
jgi:probable addiction module antidote protein